MAKIPSYLLNLAGEYRVCSELNKRGVFATVTYGNRKSVDLYAISDRHGHSLKIEVKSAQQNRFITNIAQKSLANDRAAPDFWVLFQIRPDGNDKFKERFFILTHKEICAVQAARNRTYRKKFFKKHRRSFDQSKGVDNVTVADIARFEDQWSKIVKRLG
jgi:hypothetical protein